MTTSTDRTWCTDIVLGLQTGEAVTVQHTKAYAGTGNIAVVFNASKRRMWQYEKGLCSYQESKHDTTISSL